MSEYEVKPKIDGNEPSIEELYNYCLEHSEVRHWQGDMFVKRNDVVAKVFEPCVQHGDVGIYKDWYVVYNSYYPWYENIKENVHLGRFRYEAMHDGTYYKEIEV